jgi:hypothetical protein
MIGMKDEKEIKFKRGCWNINLILVLSKEKKRKFVNEKSGDSFRDIVRKKRKFVNDESYVSSSECYKSVVKFLLVVFKESVSETDMSNDSW